MTPVQWWSYPILAATALLGGLVTATYVRSSAQPAGLTGTAGGGLLSALAIGCPVCNKLVVVLLGVSGAMSVWAPLQPVLGLASVALLGWALRTRLVAERACPMPTSRWAVVGHGGPAPAACHQWPGTSAAARRHALPGC
jgi:hypothetical protein